jgi:Protein of unknown function (DUF2726)/Topoisomerase DNA binding C4 zinc finger
MDGTTLVIVIVIAFIALQFFLRSDKAPRSRRKPQMPSFQPTPEDEDEDSFQGFPYAVQNHFLSSAELSFFQSLRRVTGNRAVVCAKVGLGDVFWIKLDDKSKFRGYRNKIDRKHVDFLLCDPATMRPLVGIELDDSSHEREDRQARDAFVDGVFSAAKLPLLHISVQRAYVAAEIEAQIAPYLGVSSTPATPVAKPVEAPIPAAAPPATASQAIAPPSCPKCGSKMILRVAKNGANPGTKFWGCATYPTCRGMLPYTQKQA